jgi:hypothetical protein
MMSVLKVVRVIEHKGINVLKIVTSTVRVHSVWHDIYVATETGGQLYVTLCTCARMTKKVRGAYTAMHKQFFCEYAKPRCTNP